MKTSTLLRASHRVLVSRVPAVVLGVITTLLLLNSAHAQVQRDKSAVTALSTAIARLGGSPPQDSVATASIASFTGSNQEKGSITLETRGMDQSSENVTLPSGTRNAVFSRGLSNDRRPNARVGEDPLSFELSLTAQSPAFPLPWLASRYANPDVAIEDLGKDSVNGVATVHLRLMNTFASQPTLKGYANFTTSEVWIDAASGLPVRISYERRDAGGASPGIPVAYEFSDYRNVQGLLYPFHVRKFFNGVLQADIVVQGVKFNSGLSDTAFAVN